MGDEKEGPYKVVISAGNGHVTYSVAKQQSEGALKTVVSDAGDAQMSRRVCNLLNKDQKRLDAEWLAKQREEMGHDEAQGTAG